MSLESKEKITCPHCRNAGEITIWESLNASLDPDAKKALIDGSLMSYHCPACGERTNVAYDLLYHDMDKQVMIQLVNSDESEQNVADAFTGMRNEEGSLQCGKEYRLRIVRSANELREKAYIFDRGLDDRAIELMKLIIFSYLQQSQPESEIDRIFLDINDGEPESFVVLQTDGKWGKVNFQQEMYDTVVNTLGPEQDGPTTFFVDTGWATEHIRSSVGDGK